jgi:predicted metal-dependent TIM-barrel fold hydrolase
MSFFTSPTESIIELDTKKNSAVINDDFSSSAKNLHNLYIAYPRQRKEKIFNKILNAVDFKKIKDKVVIVS